MSTLFFGRTHVVMSLLMLISLMAGGHAASNRTNATTTQSPTTEQTRSSTTPLIDFLDAVANTTVDSHNMTHAAKNARLKPIFIFRQFILNRLEKMGKRDVHHISEGDLLDEGFTNHNEMALIKALNHLNDKLLKTKYNGYQAYRNNDTQST